MWGQAVTSHVHQARAFTLTSTSRAVAEAPSIEMGSYLGGELEGGQKVTRWDVGVVQGLS